MVSFEAKEIACGKFLAVKLDAYCLGEKMLVFLNDIQFG